jgi:hypothetical protein
LVGLSEFVGVQLLTPGFFLVFTCSENPPPHEQASLDKSTDDLYLNYSVRTLGKGEINEFIIFIDFYLLFIHVYV